MIRKAKRLSNPQWYKMIIHMKKNRETIEPMTAKIFVRHIFEHLGLDISERMATRYRDDAGYPRKRKPVSVKKSCENR